MRKEDGRLLSGRGRYISDLSLPGQAHAVVLRSSHAHAIIHSIDASSALRMLGVLAVITGRDAEVAALGRIPWEVAPPGAASGASSEPLQPVLAADRARYVGEPLALIVADSLAVARDAAEQIAIDYEPLETVTEIEAAVSRNAPAIWTSFPDNIYFRFEKGDVQAVETAFAAAAHVTELRLTNNRLAANPLEPRGYIGSYDPRTERYTLHAAASKPHLLQRTIARAIFGISEDRMRVIVGDVGGGFGAKNHVYPEQVLVLLAAKRLSRPVRWISDRSEMLLSDAQGRDQLSYAALALDSQGRFLAIKARTLANLGAYLSPRGVVSPLASARTLPGVYAIPAAFIEIRTIFTHTAPTAPYRGAGQPEVMLILERIVDCAARELGIPTDELRRRNFIRAFPYRNALGTVYDSGDFAANLERALALSQWGDFPRRCEAARARGKLRGIGMSYTIEACGFGVDEEAAIRIDENGRAIVLIGTMSNGQGHETSYSRIVAEALGIPFDQVEIVQGDTDIVRSGNGTGASRSITVGGSALHLACRELIAAAVPIAARLLQTRPERIQFQSGSFRVPGDTAQLSWTEVARAALDPQLAPDPAKPGLSASYRFKPDNYTFPNGCHVCEVEIDPETGAVALASYIMVHDVGRAIDPVIVAGQLQGGVTQGIGQALLEQVVYEPSSGQMLSGSWLDYAMPRADKLPAYQVELNEIRSTVNPLGARSSGEAGPTAAPPAVVNAIIDALAPFGIRHIDMPATPMRIWQTIAEQSSQNSSKYSRCSQSETSSR